MICCLHIWIYISSWGRLSKVKTTSNCIKYTLLFSWYFICSSCWSFSLTFFLTHLLFDIR